MASFFLKYMAASSAARAATTPTVKDFADPPSPSPAAVEDVADPPSPSPVVTNTLTKEEKASLLSILHVLDPRFSGLSHVKCRNIVDYLQRQIIKDTPERREERLFLQTHGCMDDDEKLALEAGVDDLEEDDDDDSDGHEPKVRHDGFEDDNFVCDDDEIEYESESERTPRHRLKRKNSSEHEEDESESSELSEHQEEQDEAISRKKRRVIDDEDEEEDINTAEDVIEKID